MILDRVQPGDKAPDEINVIIEISAGKDPVKYEIDKATGAMFVDRFLGTAMFYPCNYGYVPQTLSLDGDPVDVMVIAPLPVQAGAVIKCRPLGVLDMEDDGGVDMKILAVPVTKLTPLYKDMKDYHDMPDETLARLVHFFEHYKDLEEGKWVKMGGWKGVDDAKKEILASIDRYTD
jgi:inorganic pyrophosphatase